MRESQLTLERGLEAVHARAQPFALQLCTHMPVENGVGRHVRIDVVAP